MKAVSALVRPRNQGCMKSCTRFTTSPQHLSQNLILTPQVFFQEEKHQVYRFPSEMSDLKYVQSTHHNKRRGTRSNNLAFLTLFSCNSIQDSHDVCHYESRVCTLHFRKLYKNYHPMRKYNVDINI